MHYFIISLFRALFHCCVVVGSIDQTSVKGGVPLLVLVAKAHHHHVGVADQSAYADGVDLRSLAVLPEGVFFRAEDLDAAVVTGGVVGNKVKMGVPIIRGFWI